MKITVITVCYNSVKTIERAIHSVLSQDYSDKEYIIVDGGSTDGTVEIIKKYENSITKWVSEKDEGIFDAMNKGIGMAKGDVIAFLNSDDWYMESALSAVHGMFMEKECDCVCCDNYVIRKDGSLGCYDVSDIPLEDMFKRMIYYHSAIFARTEFFSRENNFDLKYKIAADYDWMLRVMEQGARIQYLHKPVFTFCYGGVSSVNVIACAREAREIAIQHLPVNKKEYRRDIDDRYYRIVMENSSDETIFNNLKMVINNENPILLWGAGRRGVQYLTWMQNLGISVEAMIDNNRDNWGRSIQGVKICSPEFLQGRMCNVIITPDKYAEEIAEEIDKLEGHYTVYMFRQLQRKIAEKIDENRMFGGLR